MYILGKPTVTLNQCYNHIKTVKTANKLCKELIPIIYNESIKRGINPAISIAQSYKETGYFNFKGVINESFHNVCGLKNSSGGGDKNPDAHKKFKNWQQGIEAYLDHLALYAGADGYPKYSSDLNDFYKSKNLKYNSEKIKKNGETNDPRHFTYLLGKCKTVESLSGNWAPSNSYGKEIINIVKSIEESSDIYSKEDNTCKKIINEIKLKLIELEKYII